MKLVLSALALSLTLAACGNNDADNDTATMGTDTAMTIPADGSTDAGATGANGTGTDMNNMNGQPGDGNATGMDNTGSGISGGQGNNADGSAPTGTTANQDRVTNDSLNNRTGMGSSR